MQRKPKVSKKQKPKLVPLSLDEKPFKYYAEFGLLGQSPVATAVAAVAATKPKLPYAIERRDLVAAELNREMETANPNWTYVEALNKDLEYWKGRVQVMHASNCFRFYRRMMGLEDLEEE